MAKSLEIRLLGPFEALAGGRPSSVSGSKREALLALLALRHGRVVAVDTLVDALWGEDLPAAPRNAVQHHVARLRAALGQDAIAGSPDGYLLEDAHVDCERFEELLGETRAALREGDVRAASEAVAVALGLWRGPALHGLTEMQWFAAEARRLEALRVDALEEQFEADLALGRHREIIAALRTTLAEAPYRERMWGQLMLALYRSGRQADALDAYQEARTALSEELGLEPGPELRRLQEAVLAQDPAIAAVPAAPARSGNLPAPVTSFVGRTPELEQVLEALRGNRLVTLTGPPGVGKSRLAVEAARLRGDETGEGAWFVDVARAGRDSDVVRVLAQALDARGPDPLARSVARLRGVDAVVVLDACEHAPTEAARVAAALLAECPGVRVLATSREALHLPAEARIHVGPLALDGDTSDSPAVALFVERARAARQGFELNADGERLAREIVRRVDGLPLAIELAAARVSVLGLPELLEAVDHRSLVGDGNAADPAHAALRALVEWSYDLLHEDEQALLQQLAVHRGGASLASLVEVAAARGLDEPTVTYLVGALVDKSIVSVTFPDDRARYDLLDSVRDYVLERLAESGELDVARRAHAERFGALAERAWSALRGPDWQFWVRRLDLDGDNLWAALAYAVDTGEAAVAGRLGTLGWHFVLAERISEGRRFLELAQQASSDDVPVEARVDLLALLAYLMAEELDLDAAVVTGEQALALATDAGSPAAIGLASTALAVALSAAGGHERAAAVADEARAEFAAAGDDWGRAASAVVRAQGAARARDDATVTALTGEMLRHSQVSGFSGFEVPAWLLGGWAAERREEREAAVEAYARAVDVASRAGMADHASFALAAMGANVAASGDLLRAEELHRRALAAAEEARSSWAAAYARLQLARVLRASGDDATAERLYGSVLTWAETPRQHLARESLFEALVGNPADAARAEAGTPSLA